MGETSNNVANVNMAQGLKIRVEDGCDLADPCDSNICPENSHCSDDWSTHTCVCDPGKCARTMPAQSPLLRLDLCGLSVTPGCLFPVSQVISGRSAWTPASSTPASTFLPV